MSLEAASYVSQLDAANPTSTDGIAQGDDHLRLIKSALVTTFPSLNAAVTLGATALNTAGTAFLNAGTAAIAANGTVASADLDLLGMATAGRVKVTNTATAGAVGGLAITMSDAADANPQVALTLSRAGTLAATTALTAPSIQKGGHELLPTGVICLWSGTVAAIPAGWALCDGTNGTPDLRGAFVLGAGASGAAYIPGQTGGAPSATATTATGGAHGHGGATGAAGGHAHTASTDVQGSHSHGGQTQGHVLSVTELPPHSHTIQLNFDGGGPPATGEITSIAGGSTSPGTTDNTGGGAAHTHPVSLDGEHGHNITVAGVADHAHTITYDNGHAHSVTVATMPPYLALAYIMKL